MSPSSPLEGHPEIPAGEVASGKRVIGRARSGVAAPPTLVNALKELEISRFGGEPLNMAAMEIGHRLRLRRLELGLTQAALANLAGCEQGDLSNIERGKGKDGPTFRVLQTLIAALDAELVISPRSLTGGHIELSNGDAAKIVCSSAPYETFLPLVAQARWNNLVPQILHKLQKKTPMRRAWACDLINIQADTRCSFMAKDFAVLVCLKGDERRLTVRNAFHKFKRAQSDTLAILQAGSEVEVNTPAADGFTLLSVPPSLYIEHLDANAEVE